MILTKDLILMITDLKEREVHQLGGTPTAFRFILRIRARVRVRASAQRYHALCGSVLDTSSVFLQELVAPRSRPQPYRAGELGSVWTLARQPLNCPGQG